MERLLFLKLLSRFSLKSKLLADKMVCLFFLFFFSRFIMKCFRHKGMLKELYSPAPITYFLQLTFQYICFVTSLSLYPAISLSFSFFLSLEKGWVSAKYVLYTSMMSTKSEMKVFVPQSCPTLWNTLNCSPPGSSVRGILQARILEWVAMPFSRGSS